MMSAGEISRDLQRIAMLLELKGENPFRVRAFQSVARTLDSLDADLGALIETETLIDIKGIGKNLAGLIEEMFKTGRSDLLKELEEDFTPEFLECLKVPGLGAKKLSLLQKELGIDSLHSLEAVCRERKLVRLKGFGEKTQEKILKGIGYLEKNRGRRLYADVEGWAAALLEELAEWPEISEISFTGQFRRAIPVINRLDLLIASQNPSEVLEKLSRRKEATVIERKTENELEVLWLEGVMVLFEVTAPREFHRRLIETTGSEEFLKKVELQRLSKSEKIDSEKGIFSSLGLPFLHPEFRETGQEFENWREDEGPLVEEADLRGIFHMHSTYSDGRNTLEEMVSACADQGAEYVGVSDHSRSAGYANGLKEADIGRQHREIDRLQKKYKKVRILKGIESDILKNGDLDYPNKVLKKFDFVIASVHSSFQMSEDEMTKRCVKALENPFCSILGHPTGRLLTVRDGFQIDLDTILEAAKENRKILELNANPYRLDLNWTVLRKAREMEIPISINPDAHSIEGLKHIRLGLLMARKAGLRKRDVFNSRTVDEALEFFHA